MKYLLTFLFYLIATATSYADVSIGVAGPLTGSDIVQQKMVVLGIQQAVDDINAKGGIHGEKLLVPAFDDACDPKQAMMVANRLINSGVKFIIGHACAEASAAAAKLYNNANVIMISVLTTSPALTDAGYKNIFRICGRDDTQGMVQANYVMRNFRASYLAVLHDNTLSNRSQAEMFKKTLNAGNFRESLFDAYVPGEKDYSKLIDKLLQFKIQLLVINGSSRDIARIAQQIKKQQLAIQIMANDTIATTDFWKDARDASEGVLMTAPPDMSNLAAADSVLKQFKSAQEQASIYTLYGYAAVQVFAQAMKMAVYPDPVRVALAMHNASFETVVGPVSFDKKGDSATASYAMYRWQGGQFMPVNN